MINTYMALIFPSIVAPMNLFLMRQSISQTPDAMIEAANVDGAGLFRICWQIVMPNQKPALMTVVIFSFQAAWNIQGGTLVFDESLAYGGITGGVRRSHARRCHDGGGGIHAHSANRDLYAGTAAGHRNHGVFGHQGLRKGVRTLAEQEKMTVDRLFCAAGGIGAWYERFCFGTL